MSELEYDKNYAPWLTQAGLTPNSDPLNIKGLLHQIIQNLGGTAANSTFVPTPTGIASTDTANIIAAANGSAKALRFASGTYAINAQLTYYAGTRWIGAAEGGTTLHLTTEPLHLGHQPRLLPRPQRRGELRRHHALDLREHQLQRPRHLQARHDSPPRTTAIKMNAKAHPLPRLDHRLLDAGVGHAGRPPGPLQLHHRQQLLRGGLP